MSVRQEPRRLKLTDKLLTSSKRLVPVEGQKQTDFWDMALPGFGVRCSYGGRKSFQVLARVNGKLKRITIGSYPSVSLAHARDQARKIIENAAKGILASRRGASGRASSTPQRQ